MREKSRERGMCPSHACNMDIYIYGVLIFHEEGKKEQDRARKRRGERDGQGAGRTSPLGVNMENFFLHVFLLIRGPSSTWNG